MTKLEELARKLTEWGPAHWGDGKVKFFESELATALEPLLEAAGDALTLLLMEGFDASDEAKHLAEQLLQWREK